MVTAMEIIIAIRINIEIKIKEHKKVSIEEITIGNTSKTTAHQTITNKVSKEDEDSSAKIAKRLIQGLYWE